MKMSDIYGTVTNLTGKMIATHAHEDGVDENEIDPSGSFHYVLHPGQAEAVMTKLDQEWFLERPNLYEITVKGKIVSKKTVESAKATTQSKGEDVLRQAKAAKV